MVDMELLERIYCYMVGPAYLFCLFMLYRHWTDQFKPTSWYDESEAMAWAAFGALFGAFCWPVVAVAVPICMLFRKIIRRGK